MAHKRKTSFNFKSYNQSFIFEGKTWDVVHKLKDTIYAVEINKRGHAQGAILKFPPECLGV